MPLDPLGGENGCHLAGGIDDHAGADDPQILVTPELLLLPKAVGS